MSDTTRTVLEVPAVLRVTWINSRLRYTLDVNGGATSKLGFSLDVDPAFSPTEGIPNMVQSVDFERKWVRTGKLARVLYAARAGISYAHTGREIRKGVFERLYRASCPCGWNGEYRRDSPSADPRAQAAYKQAEEDLKMHLQIVHFYRGKFGLDVSTEEE